MLVVTCGVYVHTAVVTAVEILYGLVPGVCYLSQSNFNKVEAERTRPCTARDVMMSRTRDCHIKIYLLLGLCQVFAPALPTHDRPKAAMLSTYKTRFDASSFESGLRSECSSFLRIDSRRVRSSQTTLHTTNSPNLEDGLLSKAFDDKVILSSCQRGSLWIGICCGSGTSRPRYAFLRAMHNVPLVLFLSRHGQSRLSGRLTDTSRLLLRLVSE